MELGELIDGDFFVPDTPEKMDWLVEQLARWPIRVHPDKTTSMRFLMNSAAMTISSLRARDQHPPEGLQSD